MKFDEVFNEFDKEYKIEKVIFIGKDDAVRLVTMEEKKKES